MKGWENRVKRDVDRSVRGVENESDCVRLETSGGDGRDTGSMTGVKQIKTSIIVSLTPDIRARRRVTTTCIQLLLS